MIQPADQAADLIPRDGATGGSAADSHHANIGEATPAAAVLAHADLIRLRQVQYNR